VLKIATDGSMQRVKTHSCDTWPTIFLGLRRPAKAEKPVLNKAYGNCSALTALNPNKGTIISYLGASFHHKILRDMPKKN